MFAAAARVAVSNGKSVGGAPQISKALRAASSPEMLQMMQKHASLFSLLNSLLEEAAVTCSALSPEMAFYQVVCY